MNFSSVKPNAMILPLPVAMPAAEDSLRFVSLKSYEHFFHDLNQGFPEITPPRPRGRGRLLSDSAQEEQKLVVHEVGDFVASFVPTVGDFSRLDKRFVIPRESWDKIPVYADYGFAVFQLKKLSGTTHPMAFEFKTRLKDQIFFPTVHIHDGEVHKREMFDHALYLQNKQFDDQVAPYRNRQVRDHATGFVRSYQPAKAFSQVDKSAGLLLGDQLVHRIEMKGRYDNQDVIASLSKGPLKLGRSSIKKYWPIAPVVTGLAGMAWFFNRRDRLQDMNKCRKEKEG
ncbi:MAG: hypothetical protein VX438_16320 [Planctomycetota bacterium]|nr:hypothetical protein [Planctomycetota bacterium]